MATDARRRTLAKLRHLTASAALGSAACSPEKPMPQMPALETQPFQASDPVPPPSEVEECPAKVEATARFVRTDDDRYELAVRLAPPAHWKYAGLPAKVSPQTEVRAREQTDGSIELRLFPQRQESEVRLYVGTICDGAELSSEIHVRWTNVDVVRSTALPVVVHDGLAMPRE